MAFTDRSENHNANETRFEAYRLELHINKGPNMQSQLDHLWKFFHLGEFYSSVLTSHSRDIGPEFPIYVLSYAINYTGP